MYVDSVYIKHFQEVAQLISPMTTAPMSGCLSFYYQVQQENDNVFSLYTRDAAGLYEEIWKMSSPGNAAWNLAEVEFSAPYPMEVGSAQQGWLPHTGMEIRRCQPCPRSFSSALSQSLAFFPLDRPSPLLPLFFLCIPFFLLLSFAFSRKGIFF